MGFMGGVLYDDPWVNTHKRSTKQQNLKLCIQNGKQDIEIAIDDDSLIGDIYKFFGVDYKTVISDKQDLAKMRENFEQIKTCLQDNSYNPLVAKHIDHCEIYVKGGQLSEYKSCLEKSYYIGYDEL